MQKQISNQYMHERLKAVIQIANLLLYIHIQLHMHIYRHMYDSANTKVKSYSKLIYGV
jgi:hypothetical protein